MYYLITSIIPFFLIKYNAKFRNLVSDQVNEKNYLLPITPTELKLYIPVAVSIGISEEIIFRGYMYNLAIEKLSLSPIIAVIIVTTIFALGHFSQGLSGVVSSLGFGAVMVWLYFITGNLMLPIIFHILYDLKIIFVKMASSTITKCS
ncbi:CPBP family intramembrane glutamic endopeptidase [Paenibacillus sp. FJAT-26967]|uniref:CPBP family intramembrane glutamic endopeptidase n=1 Tax=Paenibacillus sp. FJAT-26967 TaxID=1729690 RepID=UPI0015601F35|nr:CPBP family intramembrane glutamic endopeptidase [Paenibacillus sp. FJAT-26967]